ncbi:uncharacterized protein OCT59_019516 [Rhizophagus irregularis]|uniref:Uncharacterized protein n=1 Tax=Rhizophagus irregularis (strain DAOM 181602 / DAOM 197198 / MUCL 43194) TaxID=747089 RepID=A0A2H5U9N2_RHIID|nr:hypothetical protein GLOIN_2v944490 [Rhizophagus irregularis DAOM 181602=DAOM 197198]POG75802.1 hypothetical protein GLOIN_2v944490 [Rhizophagus irregularis DAOM 181602=DAOM 197198]UZO27315.1 hypothetical protein OCT59_019516 [Rhizophagus irregularis]GBC51524.1 hypothetical protein GLOIN_2v944490 [Rhizophagus irregularis DAOM 181602=DAOM 197198]|eukprot:XP_025182668.1 hypothetical protein GLOIN_2v944490 [Rhizophagus irregularis DAOM 181602=DAOM 197198]
MTKDNFCEMSRLLANEELKVNNLTKEKSILEKNLSRCFENYSTLKKTYDLRTYQFKEASERNLALKNENLQFRLNLDDNSQIKKENEILKDEISRINDSLEKYKHIADNQLKEMKDFKNKLKEKEEKISILINENKKITSFVKETESNLLRAYEDLKQISFISKSYETY